MAESPERKSRSWGLQLSPGARQSLAAGGTASPAFARSDKDTPMDSRQHGLLSTDQPLSASSPENSGGNEAESGRPALGSSLLKSRKSLVAAIADKLGETEATWLVSDLLEGVRQEFAGTTAELSGQVRQSSAQARQTRKETEALREDFKALSQRFNGQSSVASGEVPAFAPPPREANLSARIDAEELKDIVGALMEEVAQITDSMEATPSKLESELAGDDLQLAASLEDPSRKALLADTAALADFDSQALNLRKQWEATMQQEVHAIRTELAADKEARSDEVEVLRSNLKALQGEVRREVAQDTLHSRQEDVAQEEVVVAGAMMQRDIAKAGQMLQSMDARIQELRTELQMRPAMTEMSGGSMAEAPAPELASVEQTDSAQATRGSWFTQMLGLNNTAEEAGIVAGCDVCISPSETAPTTEMCMHSTVLPTSSMASQIQRSLSLAEASELEKFRAETLKAQQSLKEELAKLSAAFSHGEEAYNEFTINMANTKMFLTQDVELLKLELERRFQSQANELYEILQQAAGMVTATQIDDVRRASIVSRMSRGSKVSVGSRMSGQTLYEAVGIEGLAAEKMAEEDGNSNQSLKEQIQTLSEAWSPNAQEDVQALQHSIVEAVSQVVEEFKVALETRCDKLDDSKQSHDKLLSSLADQLQDIKLRTQGAQSGGAEFEARITGSKSEKEFRTEARAAHSTLNARVESLSQELRAKVNQGEEALQNFVVDLTNTKLFLSDDLDTLKVDLSRRLDSLDDWKETIRTAVGATHSTLNAHVESLSGAFQAKVNQGEEALQTFAVDLTNTKLFLSEDLDILKAYVSRRLDGLDDQKETQAHWRSLLDRELAAHREEMKGIAFGAEPAAVARGASVPRLSSGFSTATSEVMAAAMKEALHESAEAKLACEGMLLQLKKTSEEEVISDNTDGPRVTDITASRRDELLKKISDLEEQLPLSWKEGVAELEKKVQTLEASSAAEKLTRKNDLEELRKRQLRQQSVKPDPEAVTALQERVQSLEASVRREDGSAKAPMKDEDTQSIESQLEELAGLIEEVRLEVGANIEEKVQEAVQNIGTLQKPFDPDGNGSGIEVSNTISAGLAQKVAENSKRLSDHEEKVSEVTRRFLQLTELVNGSVDDTSIGLAAQVWEVTRRLDEGGGGAGQESKVDDLAKLLLVCDAQISQISDVVMSMKEDQHANRVSSTDGHTTSSHTSVASLLPMDRQVGQGPWDEGQAQSLGSENKLNVWIQNVDVLSENHSSLEATVKALNAGSLQCSLGLCAFFAKPRKSWCLIWREDKANTARQLIDKWSQEVPQLKNSTTSPEVVGDRITLAIPQMEVPETQTWIVSVNKTQDALVGMNMEGSSLTVESLSANGLIQDFNIAFPTKAIRVGDRILEVNGVRAPKGVIGECKKVQQLRITMIRDAESAAYCPSRRSSKNGGSRSIRSSRKLSVDNFLADS